MPMWPYPIFGPQYPLPEAQNQTANQTFLATAEQESGGDKAPEKADDKQAKPEPVEASKAD